MKLFFFFRNSLVRQTKDGNTPLHLCAQMNKSECMKLLLRTKPDIAHIKNNAGQTALDIAAEKNYQLCAELVSISISYPVILGYEHVL